MKVAIMQPYFFPYIGYFQLINAVDTFVVYDDVNFIKRGWINRNSILVNGKALLITVPLIKASQNKLINEISVNSQSKEYNNLLKTIDQAYNKAPFYKIVMPIVENVLNKDYSSISDLATESIIQCATYLQLNTKFCISSVKFGETKGYEKAERLKTICKRLNSKEYINAIGGIELYDKQDFFNDGLNLQFLKPVITEYKQFGSTFEPGLTIIDLMMFNSPEAIKEMLTNYKLL